MTTAFATFRVFTRPRSVADREFLRELPLDPMALILPFGRYDRPVYTRLRTLAPVD